MRHILRKLIKNDETIIAVKEAGAFLNPQFLIFFPSEEQMVAGLWLQI